MGAVIIDGPRARAEWIAVTRGLLLLLLRLPIAVTMLAILILRIAVALVALALQMPLRRIRSARRLRAQAAALMEQGLTAPTAARHLAEP